MKVIFTEISLLLWDILYLNNEVKALYVNKSLIRGIRLVDHVLGTSVPPKSHFLCLYNIWWKNCMYLGKILHLHHTTNTIDHYGGIYKIGDAIYVLQCCAKSLQSCLTLWDPMDCSVPGSSVHGIFQAR